MDSSFESIFKDSVSILNTYNRDYSIDFQVEEYFKKDKVRI